MRPAAFSARTLPIVRPEAKTACASGSPQAPAEVFRGSVEAFRSAHAFRGVRKQVAGTLAGGIEFRDRLVQVHADPADQPGGAD